MVSLAFLSFISAMARECVFSCLVCLASDSRFERKSCVRLESLRKLGCSFLWPVNCSSESLPFCLRNLLRLLVMVYTVLISAKTLNVNCGTEIFLYFVV